MQVGHLRTAHAPRLSTTGRFLPNMQSLAAHADEGKRLLTVLLLQPAPLNPGPPFPTPTAVGAAVPPASGHPLAAAANGATPPASGPAAAASGHPPANESGHPLGNAASGPPLANAVGGHQPTVLATAAVKAEPASGWGVCGGVADPLPARDGPLVEGGEIDWQHFSFSHGFRLPRLLLPFESLPPSSNPSSDLQPDGPMRDSLASLGASIKQEPGPAYTSVAPSNGHSLKQEAENEQQDPPYRDAQPDESAAQDGSVDRDDSSPEPMTSIHSHPASRDTAALSASHAARMISSSHGQPPLPGVKTEVEEGKGVDLGRPTEPHLVSNTSSPVSRFQHDHQAAVPRLEGLPMDAEGMEAEEDGDDSGPSDGDEDAAGKRMTTRSRRPRAQDQYMLNAGNMPVAQAAKVVPVPPRPPSRSFLIFPPHPRHCSWSYESHQIPGPENLNIFFMNVHHEGK